MKKVILLGVLIVLGLSVYAQTEKGRIMVSGSTSMLFSNVKQEFKYNEQILSEPKIVNFQLSPSVMYFIMDDFAVGMLAGINTVKVKEDGGETKKNTLLLDVACSYYMPTNNIVKPVFQGAVGFARQKQDEKAYGGQMQNTRTFAGLHFSLGAGAAIFVIDNASLNIGLSYNISRLINTDDQDYKLNSSSLVGHIGFSLYF